MAGQALPSSPALHPVVTSTGYLGARGYATTLNGDGIGLGASHLPAIEMRGGLAPASKSSLRAVEKSFGRSPNARADDSSAGDKPAASNATALRITQSHPQPMLRPTRLGASSVEAWPFSGCHEALLQMSCLKAAKNEANVIPNVKKILVRRCRMNGKCRDM